MFPFNDVQSNKFAEGESARVDRFALVIGGTELAQPLLTIVAQLAASGELAVSETRCGLGCFTAA